MWFQYIVLQLALLDSLIGEIHVMVLHNPTSKQNPLKAGQENSPFPNVALSET